MKRVVILSGLLCFSIMAGGQSFNTFPVTTQKPPLHGRHWMAVTGKPLAATAGAMIFDRGGNAVDAACAMLAASCTMWDVLSWGGETQALLGWLPRVRLQSFLNRGITNTLRHTGLWLQ